jgi:hypothetical protein
MACEYGFVLHPWHGAERAAALLERAALEIGLSRVTVPVVTGGCAQFSYAPADGPRLFFTEGGWHYPPDAARYAGGALRPKTARWLAKRHPLDRIREAAERHGLRCNFQIDLRGLRGVIEQQPESGCRTAWNEPLPGHAACLNQPAVRQLLRSTIDELLSYGPAALMLAGLPAEPGERARPRWGVNVETDELLGVCFCAACREVAAGAGVDADQAARSVQVHIERLAVGDRASTAAAMREDGVLETYRAAVRGETGAWLARLAGVISPADAYFVTGVVDGPVHLSEPWRPLLEVRLTDDEGQPDPASHVVGAAGLNAGAARLPAYRPAFHSSAELVRLTGELAQAGARLIEFSGFDAAPPDAGDWLRQAVRFARRG